MANDVEFNDRRVSYTATADQTVFDIDFPIGDTAGAVVVYQNGTALDPEDYTVDVDGLTVTLDTGAALNDSIVIDGDTDPVRETAFPRGGDIRTLTLNGDFRRIFYILQEQLRDSALRLSLNPAEDIGVSARLPLKEIGKVLIWGGDGLENGPSSDEIEAAQSYALDAANSALAAAASASSAAAAVVTLQGLIDGFDDLYLGEKSADPAVDNDGDPLQDGALYWNTTDNVMKVYDLGATTWRALNPESFVINDLTPLAAAPALNDLLPLLDVSAGVQKKISVQYLLLAVGGLSGLSSPDLDDVLGGVDVSETEAVSIEIQEILAAVNKLPEDESPEADADFLLGYDVSEGVPKKIKPEKVAGSYSGSIGASGYTELTNGVILQWGTIPATNTGTVTFPVEFSSACFHVSASCAGARRTMAITSTSVSSFDFEQRLDDGSNNAATWTYSAIGV